MPIKYQSAVAEACDFARASPHKMAEKQPVVARHLMGYAGPKGEVQKMHITIETVRDILRSTLGHDSFTAGFVKSVIEDTDTPTASINAKGEIRYNPDFVRKNVRTGVDLFCLVFHEVLHPVFGHFIHPNDKVANIACDAIINSVISNLFAEASGSGSLFRRIYPDRDLAAILRPDSQLRFSRYNRLYEYLHPRACQQTKLSAGEVIQTLRALVPAVPMNILLLGSHGPGGTKDEGREHIPAATVQGISKDFIEKLPSTSNGAGCWDHLKDLLVEVLKTKKTIRQSLLTGYTTRRKLDGFFDEGQQMRRITSPFPINPSRRDIVLLSAGIWPGFFRNRQPEIVRRQKGIAVFLDVSGSVNDYLPKIIGILSGFRDRIRTIHLFSNAVLEVPFGTLCQGNVQTTYGTDFDCIAKTILEKEYERAVVITDGYGGLKEENSAALKKAGSRILTILFAEKDECPEFEPFGEVVKLEDVTEG